jgi:hypothetical protein
MHPHQSLLGFGFLCTLFLIAPSVTAQEKTPSDSSPSVTLLASPLLLRSPTLVVLVPPVLFDSLRSAPEGTARNHPELGRLADLATSSGFDFAIRPPATAVIQDQRYAAVYQAPAGVASGYILFAPGLRPKLIPTVIPEEQLGQELRRSHLYSLWLWNSFR